MLTTVAAAILAALIAWSFVDFLLEATRANGPARIVATVFIVATGLFVPHLVVGMVANLAGLGDDDDAI